MFEKTAVTVFSKDGTILLRGHREAAGAKLWRFSLRPQNIDSAPLEWQNGPVALNARDLSSVGALIRYLHTAAGFPVKSTGLAAIKASN